MYVDAFSLCTMLRPHPPTFQIVGPGAVESEWAERFFPENGWRHCGDSIPTILFRHLHVFIPIFPIRWYSHYNSIFQLYVHIISIMLRSTGFLARPHVFLRFLSQPCGSISPSSLSPCCCWWRCSSVPRRNYADLPGNHREAMERVGEIWPIYTNFIQLVQVSNISPNIIR